LSLGVRPEELLLLGYLPAYAGAYFDGVAAAVRLAEKGKDAARLQAMVVAQSKQIGPGIVRNVQIAGGYAAKLGIDAKPYPRFPKDYVEWLPKLRSAVLDAVPVKDRRSLLFTYGYDAGALHRALTTLSLARGLHRQLPLFDELVEETEKAIDEVAFRWPSSAMLAGRLPALRPLYDAQQEVASKLDQREDLTPLLLAMRGLLETVRLAVRDVDWEAIGEGPPA